MTIGFTCPTGSYCPAGSTLPVPCPMGSYSTGTSLTSSAGCKLCDAGYYCDMLGMVALNTAK